MSLAVTKKSVYTTASFLAVGAAALGVLFYRKKWLHLPRWSSKEIVLPRIFVISNTEEWLAVSEQFKTACSKRQVLGLDCEWKANFFKSESEHAVALLQLATVNDICVLIRLNKLKNNIPEDLKSLLSNKNILKVGVAVTDDARKLSADYGLVVEGCLDLRHLVDRAPKYASLERKGLKSLALSVANVKLAKHHKTRMSDWEAEELDENQVKYAAEDSVIAAIIFESLMQELLVNNLWGQLTKREFTSSEMYEEALKHCAHLLDHRYRASISPNKAIIGSGVKRESQDGVFSRKQQTRAYSVRKTLLYHNCQLQAPDGEALCTCDTKKALWYLDRGLADLVSEEPLVVRLKFEPSGRPILDNKYYVEEKENQCVVCGRQDSLVRKIVIPHEYRKFFPNLMKNHLSHDVLLLCVRCHLVSNANDAFLREQLAVECGAPLGSGKGAKCKEDPQFRKVKSAGRALKKHGDTLPATRIEELKSILKEFYNVSELTETLINVAADIETNFENEQYVNHGQKVVAHCSTNGGLVSLETRWRRHFVESMQPRFLPKMWSVEHNHQRLALQVANNQVKDFDVRILGFSESDINMNERCTD